MVPLDALSLAGNVVQFVDFVGGIVSKSSELYRSTDGQLIQHADISTAICDLSRLTWNLSESVAPTATLTVLQEDDQALIILCEGCLSISHELQLALFKLQITGAHSKWKSIRKALKTVWTKDKISALQERLSGYREQLNTRIIVGLRSRIDVVDLRQSESFAKMDNELKLVVQRLVDVQVYTDEQTVVLRSAISANAKLTNDHINGVVERSDDLRHWEHEQMTAELTQQWKSAEQQIAQLRKEIAQLEIRIAESVRQAVANNGRPDDKKQRKLNEQTNVLYKLWVAKDLMLQKLLELVRQIQSRLSNVTASFAISSSQWILGPYTAISGKASSPDDSQDGVDQELLDRLFQAIEQRDTAWLNDNPEWKDVVNEPKSVLWKLHHWSSHAPAETVNFYMTMLRKVGACGPAMEDDLLPEVHVKTTPLIWAIINPGTYCASNWRIILAKLLAAGAKVNARDSIGLMAYDHARIRGYETWMDPLYPYAVTGAMQNERLLHFISSGNIDSLRLLLEHQEKNHAYTTRTTVRQLDVNAQSPIALAIKRGHVDLIVDLLECGASPFTTYDDIKSGPFPSLAMTLMRPFGSTPLCGTDSLQHRNAAIECLWIGSCCPGDKALRELLGRKLEILIRIKDPLLVTSEACMLDLASVLGDVERTRSLLRVVRCKREPAEKACRFAAYLAVRRGHAQYFAMLLEELPATAWEAMKHPIPRHVLGPFPLPECRCAVHGYSIYNDSLRTYLSRLMSEKLCESCTQRKPSYKAMARMLDEYFKTAREP